MGVGDTAADCLFCQATRSTPDDLQWHDRPITQVPGVGAVIPGLGAFVPGYVLVFPEQHVGSTLRIADEASFAFNDLLHQTIDLVSEFFGPVTVFEHGSCSRRDRRRSACIDHAHTHIIPGLYGLSNFMPKPLGQFADRTVADGASYLLLDEPPYGPRYGPDPGISQYLRRCIAARLGVPDEWDYLMFPRLENVQATAQTLSGHFAPARITGMILRTAYLTRFGQHLRPRLEKLQRESH